MSHGLTMKKEGMWTLILCVIISILGMAQSALPQSSSPARPLSSLDFVREFKKVIDASGKYFDDIVYSSGTLEILSKECNKVSVTFPDAIKAGYHFEEAWDYYWDEKYFIHKIIVLYYQGTDTQSALAAYNQVRIQLQKCQREQIGGVWKSVDEDINGITKYHKSFSMTRAVDDENYLRIILYYEYDGSNPASVHLDIAMEYTPE